MFGSIINRFQTFSPATSPVTSPKMSRRKFKSPAHRRSLKDEYRDVQSEPEDAFTATPLLSVDAQLQAAGGYGRHRGGGGQLPSPLYDDSPSKKNRSRKSQPLLSKSKSTARLDISAPTASVTANTATFLQQISAGYRQGSKSMGRLDGLKQVCKKFYCVMRSLILCLSIQARLRERVYDSIPEPNVFYKSS